MGVAGRRQRRRAGRPERTQWSVKTRSRPLTTGEGRHVAGVVFVKEVLPPWLMLDERVATKRARDELHPPGTVLVGVNPNRHRPHLHRSGEIPEVDRLGGSKRPTPTWRRGVDLSRRVTSVATGSSLGIGNCNL